MNCKDKDDISPIISRILMLVNVAKSSYEKKSKFIDEQNVNSLKSSSNGFCKVMSGEEIREIMRKRNEKIEEQITFNKAMGEIIKELENLYSTLKKKRKKEEAFFQNIFSSDWWKYKSFSSVEEIEKLREGLYKLINKLNLFM